MIESNDAPGMKPAEWLTELLASDLPNEAKVYAVLVASCADEDGYVLIDDDGMPSPFSSDMDLR